MSRTVDVAAVINENPVSRLQVRVIALCLLIAIFEGFDVQAIGFIAPAASAEWGLSKGAFGPIFSVGTFGILVGNFLFGSLADRFGRRALAIGMVTLFGVMSLATAFSQNVWELTALRFVMGFGMGGVMPNITAMVNEYTPSRQRVTAISVMYCGVPLGGVIGGFLGAFLIADYGWRSILIAGGVLPLLLVAALVPWLPESVAFLTSSGREPRRIADILRRIDPSGGYDEAMAYRLPEKKMLGMPVAQLFRDHRAPTTILVWITFFANLLCLQFLLLWMPTILRATGIEIGSAVALSAVVSIGAVIGAVLFARLADRYGAFLVLCPVFALATVGLVLAGFVGNNVVFLVSTLFVAVATVNGAQCCLNGVASGLYPTAIRSTAMGWALGVGRVGSITGPAIGGIILNLGWGGPSGVFFFVAPVSLVTTIAVYLLWQIRTTYDRETAASPAAA